MELGRARDAALGGGVVIRVSQQWAVLIDITNACALHCSNCTRLLDHARQRFFMTPECFEQAIRAVKDFPTKAEPCVQRSHIGGRRVVGLMGGDPLLHPQFPEIVEIMVRELPQACYRGLFTSKDWRTWVSPKWGPARPVVEKLLGPNPTHDGSGPSEKHACGWINYNPHTAQNPSRHTPVLVASKDAIPDERQRWDYIEHCWVNHEWSATVTPKGFFFCEIAGALDMVMEGPGGLPLEPGVWQGDITFETDAQGVRRPVGKFAAQIEAACPNCGACLPMTPRLDADERDDMSVSNFVALQALKSPRVRRGEVVRHDFDAQPFQPVPGTDPSRYMPATDLGGYK